jgi:orotate phosphoribosyltransferase
VIMPAVSSASGDSVADEVAAILLRIGAVSLSPRELYTWSSGVRSPIYCDNRRLLSFPKEREEVVGAWSQLVLTRCPDVQVLAGVATAGIPHAALLADRLRLPMVYVRPEPKDHGLGKAIEGLLPSGSRVVVIEDLISTAGSLLKATDHLRAAGAKVLAASSIVSYELPQSRERLAAASLPAFTLTDLTHLLATARRQGALREDEIARVEDGMRSVDRQLRERGGATSPTTAPPAAAGKA